jgi:4-hydroxy-3-methylbut-2-enyl diphosphate reductase
MLKGRKLTAVTPPRQCEWSVLEAARQHIGRTLRERRPPLTVLLARPRGFCAGVERAIAIVRETLRRNGPPVYVRHEIVHNRHVVEELRAEGAVFVDELDAVPEDGIVVFSAHGIPKSVPAEARRRRLVYADATCPLVSKVHREVEHHVASGRTVLLIGHAGHPEVVGTMGQVPPATVVLVETVEQAGSVDVPDATRLAYATQTTLSVTDTAAIVAALEARFPGIVRPRGENICYATTNRQRAIATIAARADVVLVVGAPNSSNSRRLVEVARDAGCAEAMLIERAADIDWARLVGCRRLGLSAGASAPEVLVDEVVAACRARFEVAVEEVRVVEENVFFRAPPPPMRRAG